MVEGGHDAEGQSDMKALEKFRRSARKRRKEAMKFLGSLGRSLRKAYRGLRRAVRRASGKVTVHWLNLRRRSCEAVGIGAYSRMALHGLDTRLERHLPQRGGFFVEAGAHDGVTFSNTYYLEKIKGWRGILVEPIGELAARCEVRRKRSRVVQAALVASDYPDKTIRIRHASLMSVVEGAYGNPGRMEAHAELGRTIQGLEQIPEFAVPARTLTAILEESGAPPVFELLSLDVEGYEVEALKGLDLERYRPEFICIETENLCLITEMLADRYQLTEQLTGLDYLFRRLPRGSG